MESLVFESSVNSEGIETAIRLRREDVEFESSVNSEGIETQNRKEIIQWRLRAV